MNWNVDKVISIILVVIFFITTIVFLLFIARYAFLRRKSIKEVSHWIADLKWGMMDKRKCWTVFYFTQFIAIRILLGIVISLTGIIPSIAQAALFLLFVLISFTFSFLRVFESIFRHVANWLLELSLVLIAIFTIYEEAKGASENVGKGFVIFFTVIQLIVFVLIMIGLVIDIVKWCI